MQRFIEAQERKYPLVYKELRDGKKQSHWIWFIFPQLLGLGSSFYSYKYGLTEEEAKEYLKNKLLKKRLYECCRLVLSHDKPIVEIMGSELDAKKLQSSMTLFYLTSHKRIFKKVLKKFYEGQLDENTKRRLNYGIW